MLENSEDSNSYLRQNYYESNSNKTEKSEIKFLEIDSLKSVKTDKDSLNESLLRNINVLDTDILDKEKNKIAQDTFVIESSEMIPFKTSFETELASNNNNSKNYDFLNIIKTLEESVCYKLNEKNCREDNIEKKDEISYFLESNNDNEIKLTSKLENFQEINDLNSQKQDSFFNQAKTKKNYKDSITNNNRIKRSSNQYKNINFIKNKDILKPNSKQVIIDCKPQDALQINISSTSDELDQEKLRRNEPLKINENGDFNIIDIILENKYEKNFISSNKFDLDINDKINEKNYKNILANQIKNINSYNSFNNDNSSANLKNNENTNLPKINNINQIENNPISKREDNIKIIPSFFKFEDAEKSQCLQDYIHHTKDELDFFKNFNQKIKDFNTQKEISIKSPTMDINNVYDINFYNKEENKYFNFNQNRSIDISNNQSNYNNLANFLNKVNEIDSDYFHNNNEFLPIKNQLFLMNNNAKEKISELKIDDYKYLNYDKNINIENSDLIKNCPIFKNQINMKRVDKLNINSTPNENYIQNSFKEEINRNNIFIPKYEKDNLLAFSNLIQTFKTIDGEKNINVPFNNLEFANFSQMKEFRELSWNPSNQISNCFLNPNIENILSNKTPINFNINNLLEYIYLQIENKNSNFDDFTHYLYNNISKSRIMNSHENYTFDNIENIKEFMHFNFIRKYNENKSSLCNQPTNINTVLNADYKTPGNTFQSFQYTPNDKNKKKSQSENFNEINKKDDSIAHIPKNLKALKKNKSFIENKLNNRNYNDCKDKITSKVIPDYLNHNINTTQNFSFADEFNYAYNSSNIKKDICFKNNEKKFQNSLLEDNDKRVDEQFNGHESEFINNNPCNTQIVLNQLNKFSNENKCKKKNNNKNINKFNNDSTKNSIKGCLFKKINNSQENNDKEKSDSKSNFQICQRNYKNKFNQKTNEKNGKKNVCQKINNFNSQLSCENKNKKNTKLINFETTKKENEKDNIINIIDDSNEIYNKCQNVILDNREEQKKGFCNNEILVKNSLDSKSEINLLQNKRTRNSNLKKKNVSKITISNDINSRKTKEKEKGNINVNFTNPSNENKLNTNTFSTNDNINYKKLDMINFSNFEKTSNYSSKGNSVSSNKTDFGDKIRFRNKRLFEKFNEVQEENSCRIIDLRDSILEENQCNDKENALSVNSFNNGKSKKGKEKKNFGYTYYIDEAKNRKLRAQIQDFSNIYSEELENTLKIDSHKFMYNHFPEMYNKIENFFINIFNLKKKRENSYRKSNAVIDCNENLMNKIQKEYKKELKIKKLYFPFIDFSKTQDKLNRKNSNLESPENLKNENFNLIINNDNNFIFSNQTIQKNFEENNLINLKENIKTNLFPMQNNYVIEENNSLNIYDINKVDSLKNSKTSKKFKNNNFDLSLKKENEILNHKFNKLKNKESKLITGKNLFLSKNNT